MSHRAGPVAKVAIDHETRTVSNDLRSLQSGISSAHGGARDGISGATMLAYPYGYLQRVAQIYLRPYIEVVHC